MCSVRKGFVCVTVQVFSRAVGHHSQLLVGMATGRGADHLVMPVSAGRTLAAALAGPGGLLRLQKCWHDRQCGVWSAGRGLRLLWSAGIFCFSHCLLPSKCEII